MKGRVTAHLPRNVIELSVPQDVKWKLPKPLSTHNVQMDDGTVIVLRRHGNPDGPRLVMSHGNGLAIDLYYPFWSRLTDDFDLFVYDQRNHGWNELSSLEYHNVPALVADHDAILEAIDNKYGLKSQVGVYHSVSALVSLLSPVRGVHYSALVLFDPPICKPGRSHEEFEAAAVRAAGFARKRTERFRSREQFSDFLPFLPPFQRFAPGVFELMASTTLRERSNGEQGYELRCPAEYEAQIIDYASAFGVNVDFDTLTCPVKVIGADPTLPYSYLPTLDMTDILSVNYDFLPESTHFLQLERPEACAEVMREFLSRIEFG